jgi:gluconolactonase
MLPTRLKSLLAMALITVASSTAFSRALAHEKPAALGSIVRLDPAFDELVPKDARLEKLADGFTFTEGPLWRPSGVLWFSDVVANVVRQWSPDGRVMEILNPGGYDGKGNLPAGGYNGPNGMTADKDGAVLL